MPPSRVKPAPQQAGDAPDAPDARVARGAAAGLSVHLSYSLVPGGQGGAALDNPLFQLLAAVSAGGSIRRAAQLLGVSYRHAWDSLKRWEQTLGAPLITWSQGQKARLTEYAERLVWAERGARTRLQPHIEALRTDLSRAVVEAREGHYQLLTVRASHDIALSVLQQHVAQSADLHLNIGFQGSAEALQALNDRQCLVAGFHVPVLQGAAPVFRRTLKPLLRPGSHRLIACSCRTQGLIVRKEHAAAVRTLADVARLGLRFVNRQPGAGTRMLVEHLLQEAGLPAHALAGFDGHVEHTHVAVALCVASGMADAGIGIEAAALQFGLQFVPIAEENYFLVCLSATTQLPAVIRLRQALAAAGWQHILAGLPGYRPAQRPGSVLAVDQALPWWRRGRRQAAD